MCDPRFGAGDSKPGEELLSGEVNAGTGSVSRSTESGTTQVYCSDLRRTTVRTAEGRRQCYGAWVAGGQMSGVCLIADGENVAQSPR